MVMWAPQLVTAIIILLVFWALASTAKNMLLRLSKHAKVKQQNIIFLTQIIKAGIFIIGLISAMGSIGINVNALITGLGVTGFAISFAMKDIVSNMLAGLLILIYQPFKVGTKMTVNSKEGTVQEINMRHTVLLAHENILLIPNAKMLNDIVTLKDN